MLTVTLIVFILFIIFQIIYIIIPLSKQKPMIIDNDIKEFKGISILVPAYNEELVIKNSIDAIRNLDYKYYETIIINDGSKDNTIPILKDYLKLKKVDINSNNRLNYQKIISIYKSEIYKNIVVIDKENGGKADALNAGIDYSQNELVVTIDADSMLAADSLSYINQYFSDEKIIAAGGTVHIAQGVKKDGDKIVPFFKGLKGLVKFQIVEYLSGFYIRKFTQSKLKSMLVIAGAFGVFNKDVLIEIGGYRNTVGEDMDITLKVQKYIKKYKEKNYEITYMPEAACYTECPETYSGLFTQRFRWQRAFIDCAMIYWTGFLDNFGLGVSIYFLVDSLLLGTIMIISGFITSTYVLLGYGEFPIRLILIMFIITLILAIIQNITSLYLSYKMGFKYSRSDYLKMLIFYPLDIGFYRIIGTSFVIIGTYSYFFRKTKWGTAPRKGTVSIS